MGCAFSSCRLVSVVLCDTLQQLSPLPRGGQAAQAFCCLWEVAPWLGGAALPGPTPLLVMFGLSYAFWVDGARIKAECWGCLHSPALREGTCAPADLGVGAWGFHGA